MVISSFFIAGDHPLMSSYFSFTTLGIFLPLCIFFYSLMPLKIKKYCLLLVSWLFFWFISGTLIIYLWLSIISIYYFGIWLNHIHLQKSNALKESTRENRKQIKKEYLFYSKMVLLFAALLHIGVLLVLKYTPFFMENMNWIFQYFQIAFRFNIPAYLMPIGISFFTLQAVSYLFDVYRGTIKADDNIFRLALFMSFFPQIVEGPICRYQEMANQLWEVKAITYDNLTLGMQRILFGLMKKLVIADRLNPLIQTIFSDYTNYEGGIIAIAAVCYTVQLYMDFSGTMDAVIGIAQIFGVTMPENFKRPFFSKTISEFWSRWHISLGKWFKDYVFYPITMSKSMKQLTKKSRKKIGNHYGPLLAGSIALLCVWFCNGLWHGAAWNYIFFGMYHFVLILSGNLLEPVTKTFIKKLHLNPIHFIYQIMQMIRTTVLVIIGELFFRAEGLEAGIVMFRKIITDFHFTSWNLDLLSQLGVDMYDFLIVGVALALIFIVSILNEKGINIRLLLQKQPVLLRWSLLYAFILFIVIFGAYGPGYLPVDPIYAEF